MILQKNIMEKIHNIIKCATPYGYKFYSGGAGGGVKYISLYLIQKITKKKHTVFLPQKAPIHLPFTLMKQALMFFPDFP